MKTFYEVVIQVARMQQDGTEKKVTVKYLVRSDECIITDAVNTASEQIAAEYEVTSVKKTKVTDVLGIDNKEKLYDAKVQIITIDERTAKEKKSTIEQVVWADSLNDARLVVDKEYLNGMLDYKITDIHETAYCDVL